MSVIKICELKRDNYDSWKIHAQAMMVKNGVWGYVDGTNLIPPSLTGADAAAREVERRNWLEKDQIAKADLILSIGADELHHVGDCVTSRDVWLKLESVFAPKGPLKKVQLLKTLLFTKLQEGGDIREHVRRFFGALDKLATMKIHFHPDVVSIALLYSLPASFEQFKLSIEARDELPSADVLKAKILEHAETQSNDEMVQAAGAMAIRNNSKASKYRKLHQNGNKPDKSKIRCFICGAHGHKSPDCKEQGKAGHANKRNSKKQTANTADESYAVCFGANSYNIEECKMPSDEPWILDSGCTSHLCNNREKFNVLKESTCGILNLASNSSTAVQGSGNVVISMNRDGYPKVVELKDTLFVPDLRSNLVSVAKITDTGHAVTFTKDSATITDQEGRVRLSAVRKNNLYFLSQNSQFAKVSAIVSQEDLKEWHEKLGHLNFKDVVKIIKDTMGLDAEKVKIPECDVCIRGKMTSVPYTKSKSPCKETLRIVHSDVVGKTRVQSLNGAKYFVSFIDDASRWSEIYLLGRKNGVISAFEQYKSYMENQTGKSIKCLQSDNGSEYCSADFDGLLKNYGIQRRLTVPYSPQQNGVAERFNRTIIEMARCLLLQSKLPQAFWAEAVATACYIRNRSPTTALGGMSPYEKLKGEKPDVSNLHIFGSTVYVLDKIPTKDKFAPRSVKGIFVGYPREAKGFRVWLPDERKIVIARDVKFVKNVPDSREDDRLVDFLDGQEGDDQDTSRDSDSTIQTINTNIPVVQSSPKKSDSGTYSPKGSAKSSSSSSSQARTPPASVPLNQHPPRGRGRPRLVRSGHRGRPRKIFQASQTYEDNISNGEMGDDNVFTDGEDEDCKMFAGVAEVSVSEALNGEEREAWERAIQSEITSLIKNDTFKIVKCKDGQNVVGSRFVLTKKYQPDGSINRFKARIVAKGYSQRFGVDYHQTFAPVARLQTIRLLMAISASYGLQVHQIDIVTAYLNGVLDEEVIMEMPDMLEEILKRIANDADKNIGLKAHRLLNAIKAGGNVCRLNKALYGLRQGGRKWNEAIDARLKSLGLTPTIGEPCLYYANRDNDVLFLLLYVDDILIASKSTKWIEEIKRGLAAKFEVKDLGLAKSCLGLEISQSKDRIIINQRSYILDILQRFGMSNCNTVSTPSELKFYESDVGSSGDSYERFPYRELIGALMYLSVSTRPDISNTVTRLAQFTSCPKRWHIVKAKRVLRYLAGTTDLGLVYTKSNEPVIGYSDADWGGDPTDRCSFTGYVFTLSNAAISWRSQKQQRVALSTTEAEYVSLSEALKEAVHLRSLLMEIGLNKLSKITVFTDNRGAECIANNPVFHKRTKHIDIKFHFIRSTIKDGLVNVQHVPTQEMVADVLTKPLARVNHEHCVSKLGLIKY